MTDQDTRRIIDLIKDGRERTASEIGERLGVERRSVTRALTRATGRAASCMAKRYPQGAP